LAHLEKRRRFGKASTSERRTMLTLRFVRVAIEWRERHFDFDVES
jgi:hypothetical protein